jgi:tripartite-type tricarboxylate transporter receptor subunit TctC
MPATWVPLDDIRLITDFGHAARTASRLRNAEKSKRNRPVKRLLRFQFLVVVALAACWSAAAAAQELPSGTGRIIVPYPAGGPLDTTARLLAEGLKDDLGRTFIVENKPGANGTLGAQAAAHSAPDGMTLLAITDTILTANPSLYRSVQFDPVKDFDPISVIGSNAVVLAVHKSVPAKSLAELVALMKMQNLNFSTAGNGSPSHLAYAYFAMRAGVKGTPVAYRGGAPAARAVGANEVHAGIVSPAALKPFIQKGDVVPLAVLDTHRIGAFKSVPTAAEGGIPDLVVRYYSMQLAPAGTPPALIERFNRSIRKTFAQPANASILDGLGLDPDVSSPKEAAGVLRKQTQRWSEVIRTAGIKLQ